MCKKGYFNHYLLRKKNKKTYKFITEIFFKQVKNYFGSILIFKKAD